MDIEKKKNFLINFAYWALIAVLALLTIRYILPISLPFVFSFLFAYLIVALSGKIGCQNRWFRLLLTFLLYGGIGLFIGIIASRAVDALTELTAEIPGFYNQYLLPMVNDIALWAEGTFQGMDPAILDFLQDLSKNLVTGLTKLVSFLSKWLVNFISSAASGVPATLLSILVMIISTVFVVMDAERIRDFAQANLPKKAKAVGYQIRDYLTGTILVVLRSYMIIMFITFTELTILFWIFGIPNPAVKASLIAVLDILPLLGTGGVMIPWAIISMVAGSMVKGIKLLVIYGIVTVVRNYLEPKIVGTQLGLHPIITLVSMFLGLRLFGFLGMFGLPLTISFLWKQYTTKKAEKAAAQQEASEH